MKKIILLLLLTTVLYAQQSEKITAKIGNISISENEFRYRYELVPRLNAPVNPHGLKDRENFLYGLITEKLLSLGAREIKLDTVELVRNTLKSYEKMFVRDALYRKEVLNKSFKYADDLLSFYVDHPNSLLTRYICYNDSSKIYSLWGMLNKGVPFDTVYSSLSKFEKDTMTIVPGQLEDAAERSLFSLFEKSISKPMKIKDGWFIFFIDKSNAPVAAKVGPWETDYKRIERAAKDKAEQVFYRDYISTFFKNKKIEANGFLLKSFSDKVTEIFKVKYPKIKPGGKIYLDVEDLVRIEGELGYDTLNRVFIKLPGRSITFKDYLNWYRTENFNSANDDAKNILGLLSARTRKFIEEELLYDEGIKQGMDKDPSVQKDIAMWRDSYLSQIMAISFQDSVQLSEKDVNLSSLKKDSSGSVQVNIVEVLTKNLDDVEQILNELKSGTDIHDVAAKYSTREDFKNNKGESGFFPSGMYGDIGRIAAGMNVGDLYGPVKLPEGYSVFKLIGKKIDAAPPVNEAFKKQLYYNEVRDKLNNYVASLARKYGVEIDDAVLGDIQLTKITSIVFRYLGFGGKITAVPFNNADIEWSKTYKDKSNL